MLKGAGSWEDAVIAAVRSPAELPAVLETRLKTVFLLGGDLQSLPEAARLLKARRRHLFLHIDLLEGVRNDASGIAFVKEMLHPAGIISTRPACLKLAHEAGMLAILRVFAIDSQALRTGRQHIEACSPECIEILPGVAPAVLARAKQEFGSYPLIAGGLIQTPEDVLAARRAGAAAVSTTCPAVWKWACGAGAASV